jgi:AcrR family transcriptional regulator
MASRRDEPQAPALRNSSVTIEKILAAAAEEFAAKGIDATKIEHIARRAGISKQQIYHYFSGKDGIGSELLTAIARENFAKLLQIDFAGLGPEQAIRQYIGTVYDQFAGNPVIAVMTVDQSLHAGAQIRLHPDSQRLHALFSQRLGAALEAGKGAGVFSSQIDTEALEFMTTIIVTGCVSSRSMFVRFVGRDPVEDKGAAFWREYAISFILRALRP